MITTVDSTRSLIMSEVMPPEKANFAGNIHGGHLMEMLDRVAYACAARYARCYVVTLSIDHVVFKQAIHVGELVTCFAHINYVGNTSMEVGIKVVAENLISGEKRHTNSCYFTMVAVNNNGKPTKVTPLSLDNDQDKLRFKEAQLRRDIRQKMQTEHTKGQTQLHNNQKK